MNPHPLEVFLSPRLLEASNGVLLAVLTVMTAGCLVYLWRRWRESYGFRWLYREFKHVFALSFCFGGLAIRTAPIWWLRHASNHGIPDPFWAPWATLILAVGTALPVIGGLCWLRVTLPEACGVRLWLLLMAGCFAFGALFAL